MERVTLDFSESFKKIQFWQENGKVAILPLRIYKGQVLEGKGILVISINFELDNISLEIL